MAARAVMQLSAKRGFAWSLLVGGTLVSIFAAVLGAMVPPGPLPPFATALVTVIPPIALPLAAHLARKMLDAAREADAAPAEAAPNTLVMPQETPAASAAPIETAASAATEAVPHLFEVVDAAPRRTEVKAVAAVVEESATAAPRKAAAKPRRRSTVRIADDPEVVAAAARLYAACGSFREVSRQLSGSDRTVSDRTVRRWHRDGLLVAS